MAVDLFVATDGDVNDGAGKQEVRFSAGGETLSFKHTVTDYKAYVPGVLLSIRKIVKLKTFVYGIDKLL
jgi:dihydrodipicolinate reductase